MQELKELLFILSRYKVRQIEVISNLEGAQSPSRYRQLYEFLQQHEGPITESTIATWLNEPEGSKAYHRFINNFKKRLYNSVLFIDLNEPEFNELQRAYYICQQRAAVMKTLRGRGTMLSPLEIARQILPVAVKYEFLDLALDALDVFKSYHAFHTGNAKAFEKYADMSKTYRQIQAAENLAKECFQSVQLLSINSAANGKKIHQACASYIKELTPHLEHALSAMFIAYYGLIKVYMHMSSNDWAGTIRACEEALGRLEQKECVSSVIKNAFLHQQAMSLFMLRDYAQATIIANQSVCSVDKGTFNWFQGKGVLICIKFHQGDYPGCWELYKEVTKHPQFPNMNDSIRESWNIYYAYLSFLSCTGRLALSPREKGAIQKFRMGKFLNEVPLYSKDKRGLNIPILIVQVLFLVYDQAYDSLENRIEALRKYNSLHLKENDEHFRTNCFVQLLQLLIKGDFESKKILPHAGPVIKKMMEKPLDLANQSHEIEVVPYEIQWGWVLEVLG
jgi:hypothetical protein